MTDRWQRVSGGDYHKWDTTGQSIEGVWKGFHDGRAQPDGKTGRLGTLIQPDGREVTFSITAALEDLDKVPTGTDVKIVFTGERKNAKGVTYKAFECFMDPTTTPEPGGA